VRKSKRKPTIFGFKEKKEGNDLRSGFFELDPEKTWVHQVRAERMQSADYTFLEPICLRVYYITPTGLIRYSDKWYNYEEPIGPEDLFDIKRHLTKKEGVDLRLF